MTNSRLVVVSDEPLGMGSPQIASFACSAAEMVGARATVMCPLPTDKLRVDVRHPFLEIIEIRDTLRTRAGYVREVVRLIDKLQPAILVFFSNLALPALLAIKHRPAVTINYVLESYYFVEALHLEVSVLRSVKHRIDLFIVPEPNRAAQLVRLAQVDARKLRVLYNCKRYDSNPMRLAHDRRNGKLLHQGSIFVDEEPWPYFYEYPGRFPMDAYGIIRRKGFGNDAEIKFKTLCNESKSFSYLGKVSEIELDGIRQGYSFVLCYWYPSDPTQRFACPNKFFEAIASGVPPLASPNPQMSELIRRYDCGILMTNWSLDSFADAFDYAMEIRGTARYGELVANCLRAYEAELNWSAQFAKVEPALRSALAANLVSSRV